MARQSRPQVSEDDQTRPLYPYLHLSWGVGPSGKRSDRNQGVCGAWLTVKDSSLTAFPTAGVPNLP